MSRRSNVGVEWDRGTNCMFARCRNAHCRARRERLEIMLIHGITLTLPIPPTLSLSVIFTISILSISSVLSIPQRGLEYWHSYIQTPNVVLLDAIPWWTIKGLRRFSSASFFNVLWYCVCGILSPGHGSHRAYCYYALWVARGREIWLALYYPPSGAPWASQPLCSVNGTAFGYIKEQQECDYQHLNETEKGVLQLLPSVRVSVCVCR